MSLPLRQLPVLQNWDCHVCGGCCREYFVTVTTEERERILALEWGDEPAPGPTDIFETHGPPWDRRYVLRHREDGSCVFLKPDGLCRLHAKFGAESKPFACRLYPFVLVPAGEHWRVSLRFSCPSAAANKGRGVTEHQQELKEFAAHLERRDGFSPDRVISPPSLQAGQRVGWPDLLHFAQAVLALVRDSNDRVELRLRKCLALARVCRQARFDKVTGKRLVEFLNLVGAAAAAEVPADPATVAPPGWIGRMLFRPILGLYARQDHGPDRGTAQRTMLGRLGAGWQFARGRGPVPRVHAQLPETTFERLEQPAGPLPEAAEDLLTRYYTVKVGSLQFCGGTNFRLPFWDGLNTLILTYPAILWLSRAFPDLPRAEAVTRAVSIVDNHFGHNRLLDTRRQRMAVGILAGYGELDKLVAWYSR